MDLVITFLLISFFASIAVFSYLAHKLYKRSEELRDRVRDVILALVGFLMTINGFLSGNAVTITIGSAMLFAGSSLFLTCHIKGEHGVKRLLEINFGAISLGIIIYGYFATGSLILEILTLFIAAMILISFTLSYLLPRTHVKSEN